MRPSTLFLSLVVAAASAVFAAPVPTEHSRVVVEHALVVPHNIVGHYSGGVDVPVKRTEPKHVDCAPPNDDMVYPAYEQQVMFTSPHFDPEPVPGAHRVMISFGGIPPLAMFKSINQFLPFKGAIPGFKFSVPVPHIALPFQFGGSLSAIGQGLRGVFRAFHG